MKTFLAKKRNIFLTRLFLGQLPLLVSTYLFLSRQFLNFSLVFQFLLVVINLASILVTVYLTREMRIREFEDDDLVSPRTNQLMYIGLTGFMSIICLYRGITARRILSAINCLYWRYSLLAYHASAHLGIEVL